MTTIARDSHCVPRAILRRWSSDGKRVYAYRTLVSRDHVPEWKSRSVRGLACQRDLYTTLGAGEERDEFERWIASEYEQPGLEAIDKLLRHARLGPRDWHCIGRLVAAQDVRTPLNLVESMRRWHREVPEILDSTIKNAIRKLEEAKAHGVKLKPEGTPKGLSKVVRVTIHPPTDGASDQALVEAEVPVGRRLWIQSMYSLLSGAAEVLCKHRWSVVVPAAGEEWPLTDHPVVRLNYYGPGRYDFGGGWGNPGSEIMMPLAPQQLLYVQVGKRAPYRFGGSADLTRLVQKLIVERAYRWVVATHPLPWVAVARPRLVDAQQVAAEDRAWKTWHEEQLKSEMALDASPPSNTGLHPTALCEIVQRRG